MAAGITCLCPTYGRFTQLRVSLACFIEQDFPDRQLFILNDAPVPITCNVPGVTIINAERFPNLGEKRAYLLNLAQTEIVAHWDDDELYLPWHLSTGMHILATRPEISCVKASVAPNVCGPDDKLQNLGFSRQKFDASMIFRKQRAIELGASLSLRVSARSGLVVKVQIGGYMPVTGAESRQLLTVLKHARELYEIPIKEACPSYVWRLLDGRKGHVRHTGTSQRFWERNTDFADGPLTPADLGPIKEQIGDLWTS